MIGNRIIRILERLSGQNLTDIIHFLQIYHRLSSYLVGFKFKRLASKCTSLEEYYDFVNSFNFSLFKRSKYVFKINLYQKKKELMDFIKIYKKFNPKIILEIGTYDGGTLFFLSRFASPDAKLITIDLPEVANDYGYSPAKIPFYKSFKLKGQRIHFIRAISQSPAAIKKIKKILKKEKIDVLFIDGDHSYEGVKKDFTIYEQFVKKGGLVIFHDIVEHPIELKCEVDRFWDEIKKKFKYEELISQKNEKWGGIGIIRKE